VPAPRAETIASLKAAEEERYRDVETAPALVDAEPAIAEQPEPTLDDGEPVERPAVVVRPPQFGAEPVSAFERSRSAVWPLVLALAVGVAVGFAGGYGVGTHSRPDASAASAPEAAEPAAAPTVEPAMPGAAPRSTSGQTPAGAPERPSGNGAGAAAGREFTENAVPPAPKSAGSKSPTATQSTTAKQQSTIAAGRLLVRSTPAGASVSVDGKDYGRTPAAVRDLALGAHRVRVTRDGYAAAERRVVISAARPSQSVTVPLERGADTRRATPPPPSPVPPADSRFAGMLVVDSRPSGARVYVDGKLAGTTPLSVAEIRAGEHVIRLERDGYRLWSSSVRVVAAEQNRVTASLER
jgi:hypothetical protein